MKKILPVLFSLYALSIQAQTIDSTSFNAALYFKEAKEAAKSQKIWNKPLYGPTIFVDPQTRTARANMPDSAGRFKPENGIYVGVLPPDIILANTAFDWGGKKWSMIIWPLPEDHDDRLNLVLHESFHRIQDDLGLPGNSPTINHLNTMNGRIYFLLELQALKAALDEPVNKRKNDLTCALLFREKRHLLFPETFGNEHILEMNEGLAEYTGVILGRPKDSIKSHLDKVINGAIGYKSLIRSMAYITGPVYGYLLYQAAPNWTSTVTTGSNFPALIKTYYHITLPAGDINAQVDKITNRYNGQAIIASETAKEQDHQKQLNAYVDLFTKKQTLMITSVNMSIGFNPNNLFDLGDYGIVYPTATIKDSWGDIEISEGGMLMKDWKLIYLPVNEDININTTSINGKGWKLTLNPGWKIVKSDTLHFKVVKN